MAERPKTVTIFVPAGCRTAFTKPQVLKDRLVTSSTKNKGDWIPKPKQSYVRSSKYFPEQEETPAVVEVKNDSSPSLEPNAKPCRINNIKAKYEQYKWDTATDTSSSSTSSASPESVSTDSRTLCSKISIQSSTQASPPPESNSTKISTWSSTPPETNSKTPKTLALRIRRSIEKAKELSEDAKLSSLKQTEPETKHLQSVATSVCSPNDKAIQTIWHIDVDSPVPDKCNIIEPNDKIIIPQVHKAKQEKATNINANVPESAQTWVSPEMNQSSPQERQSVKSELQQPEISDLKFVSKVESDDDWGSDDEGFSQFEAKSSCGCNECDKWLSCPEWCKNNAYFEADEKKRITNLKPFLKPRGASKPAGSKPTVIDVEKQVINNLLIHGANMMKPVESLNEVPFNKSVKESMKTLKYLEPKGIQKFLWPVILRRISVCYIGNAGSGKTMAYLPSICTFAIERDDNYQQFSNYPGPLILILAQDKKACCHIQNKTRSLLACTENPPVVEILSDGSSKVDQKNVDILISTPIKLKEALIAESVSLKRVVHVVIDDAETVLRNYYDDATKILELLNLILIHRPRNKLIHTVISSEQWSYKLEVLLKRLHSTPIVYIANQFEAALYGNVHFVRKTLKESHFRKYYLIDILRTEQNAYNLRKTIVFCEEEEIADLAEYLYQNGVETIRVHSNMTREDIRSEISVWNHLLIGHYKVLLCTDGLSKHMLKIKKSDCLVHYCLPTKWVYFVERFQALLGNIPSPLEGLEEKLNKCIIIVDETSNQESTVVEQFLNSLPRIARY